MPEYVPNTVVCVLKDVPLDDTYSDTIKFNSVGEQTGYFSARLKYRFANMTYQRVNNSVARPRGPLTVRVPQLADNLYDCNYIMFQNSNYGNKWFYAFIKQVNYINPENTEIVYEIDYFQTFLFDFEVNASFVEREHVADDSLYANTCPEPLDVDFYCVQAVSTFYIPDMFGGPYIVVACGNDKETAGTIPYGEMYGGIYSGVYYYYATDAGSVNSFLEQLNGLGKIDLVAGIYMSPLPPTSANVQHSWTAGFQPSRKTITGGGKSYTIQNNKLLSYPFTTYKIKSTGGDERILRPELCGDNGELGGILYISSASEPNFMLTPDYDHITNNFENSVTYAETVQCAWTKNAYATWQAQQGPANAMKAIAGATTVFAGVIAGLATGGTSTLGMLGAGALMGGISQTMGAVDERLAAARQPNIPRGAYTTGSMNMATGRTGFEAYHFALNPDCARRFDEYFNMYGYEVDRVKVPEMDSRANFNYVKCRNVNITGSLPVDGMDIVKACFNRGIRLWHTDITRSLLTLPNPIVSHETNNSGETYNSEVKSK